MIDYTFALKANLNYLINKWQGTSTSSFKILCAHAHSVRLCPFNYAHTIQVQTICFKPYIGWWGKFKMKKKTTTLRTWKAIHNFLFNRNRAAKYSLTNTSHHSKRESVTIMHGHKSIAKFVEIGFTWRI